MALGIIPRSEVSLLLNKSHRETGAEAAGAGQRPAVQPELGRFQPRVLRRWLDRERRAARPLCLPLSGGHRTGRKRDIIKVSPDCNGPVTGTRYPGHIAIPRKRVVNFLEEKNV